MKATFGPTLKPDGISSHGFFIIMAQLKRFRFWSGLVRAFTQRRSLGWLLVMGLALSAAPAHGQFIQTLIASNSTWRFFRGTNEASTPPTDWRTNTFDDSSWETGPAPFFYAITNGNGFQINLSYNNFIGLGTQLTDMVSNYTCIFLRQTFVLTNTSQYIAMTNRPFTDDGYITWINGVEATRFVTGSAGTFYAYNSNAAAATFTTSPRPANITNALRIGVNVLAMQVFNFSSTDGDFFANPELTALVADLNPPLVANVTPAPGSTITNITTITVTFNEAVTNVRSTDLRMNGQVANSVTTNSTNATFVFALPAPGLVQVTWSPAEAIKDLAGNIFASTNTVWFFTNIFVPPTVVNVSPPLGSSITNITLVSVTFSEVVTNVRASDLLMNGQPATSVTTNSTNAAFRFALPAPGLVQVTWSPGEVIRGLAGNTFSDTNTVWFFTNIFAPPYVVSAVPAFGASLSVLTNITVVFNAPVFGVNVSDLIVAGFNPVSVSGSGTTYNFALPAIPYGLVPVSWDANQVITDAGGVRLVGASNTWTYSLIDTTPPTVVSLTPAANATIAALTQQQVLFSEPVSGVDAADLLINSQPATSVFGSGAGPYIFQFPAPASGTVQFAWAAGHNIRDLSLSPNAFAGGSWTVTVNPTLFAGDVIINEFLAANILTNAPADLDEDNELQDWVELYNRGTNSVRLLGWSLTTDDQNPGLWTFPDVSIGAGQYLLVYASAKDRSPTNGAKLHTNFKLNVNGEYLALFSADSPRRLASEFTPKFPEQRNDYSYGLTTNGWRYFQTPTPGADNGTSPITQVIPKLHVNVDRGVFDAPFTLIVSCDTPGATLRYTTDGSQPTAVTTNLYTGPMLITNTTIFRIVAFMTNMLPSRISSHTYLFYDQVIQQPNNPAGYPATWGTFGTFVAPADYKMDPEIVTNAAYAAMIKPAMLALPVLSIAASVDDMFGPTLGIYTHPEPADAVRAQWERPASVELILTNGDPGFQADCGIRIQGNASRTPSKTPKHPMRLLFKGDYGDGKLKYQLYPDSPVDSFNSVVLRADFNNSWTHWDNNQRLRGSRIRDAWGKDTFRDMGQPGGHSRFFHLFINGLYWGVYDCSERIDSDFAANYFGGDSAEYDVMASKPTEAIDGTITAYNTMTSKVRTPDMRLLTNYTAALTYVDMTNFVDYMLLNMYGANLDWGYDGNWNALRRRTTNSLYKYIAWDCEQLAVATTDNRVAVVTDMPSGLHSNLVNSAEYRSFFADRVQRHLFNGGALTTNQLIPRWNNRANVLSTAIVAESARWGDYERDVVQGVTGSSSTAPFVLYTRNDHWLPEWSRMITNYFPTRAATFLPQLQTALLFPTVSGPTFSQLGGRIPANFPLTMSASNAIYYTTNGADPRVYGTGATSVLARIYSAPLVMSSSMTVKARAVFGTNWSPLVEANFVAANLIPQIRVTEIMYNPVGGDAFEYLELQNTGTTTLDLGNYSFTGLSFIFNFGFNLAPGQRLVLGNSLNTNAFKARYPGVAVAGWFGGNLSNGGETIALLDGTGRTVLSISYDDEFGWPVAADGGGYSLEIINPDGDPDDAANWRASTGQNGTPGQPNSFAPATTVVLNEVMAENLGVVNNGGTFPDWIEMYNPTASAVNLTGWSLTDDGNARKFVFSGTSIAAGGYLVVWADAITNTTPGLHTGFSLGRNGDDVSLYDPNTNRVDAISFGPQVGNLSIGRVGGAWALTTPTTNAVNVAAPLAAVTNLFINEWLANSAPGFDDWVELYNAATNAVPLRNLFLGTSNALFQTRALSFVPPRGFVQLFADERAGADHLDFKLAATAGAIILYDTDGAELQRVTYGAQVEGVTQGRLPDGTATMVSFPNSASPGASNYVLNYTGPVLNEILSRNSGSIPGPWGNYPDFLELYNPGTNSVDLGGFGLSDDASSVTFVFAPGTIIASNAHRVVWCDGGRAASTGGTLNSGFSLSGTSSGAYLFNTNGQVVNSVEYGFQVTDLSIGLSGGQWRLLSNPTPGSNNTAQAALGSVANLRINEWMANPSAGENDWFELYNGGAQPVSLSGLFLTDDLSVAGVSNTPVAALSFIGAQDWVKWIADQDPSQGLNHARFDLDQDGDNIRLYATNFAILDTVSFGAQADGVSQGRLPDGGTNIVNFPATPTPDASNYLPLPAVVINELLTHTDPPLEDAIEIQNTGTNTVNIGGWWISNSQRDLKKFRVAAGTSLAPGQFKVFYETNFNADGSGSGTNFTLNSAHGDAVYLSEADGAGNLTGYRAGIEFGAAENGVSFGRFVTSTGVDFTAMAARTFGSDLPATLAEFRAGLGLSNGYPKVGPVVFSEIMYHPVSGSNATELASEEFVELRNLTTNAVPMFDPGHPTNVWKVGGGIAFNFSSGVTLGATGLLTVVAFDPATNAPALAAFRAKYGTNGSIVGPYSGRLGNSHETLELSRPDAPQQAPHPDAGFVPQILVDRVVYDDAAPWPTAADGGGASLQRVAANLYGNEVLNWIAQAPTAGVTNGTAGVEPPTITGQPQSLTVTQGSTATFTVTGQGTAPLSYQWLHAGTNLPGATNVTLSIVNTQPADAGLYRVVIANTASYITSQAATLTVLVPPFISAPPQGLTVVAGSTAQFTVTAGGSSPLSYQWRRNGGDLIGQNAAQLTINSAQSGDAGNYTVVVIGAAGSITSAVAVLAVNLPPTITGDPTNLTVMANSPATFTVAVTGTAPLYYQWRKDLINLPGANAASYTVPSAQVTDEGLYSVIVTNVAGQATSFAAQLHVSVSPFLSGPRLRADGVFEFTLTGRSNGNYAVEFTTDFNGWTNLTNLTLPAAQVPVNDGGASNATSRFYRVRSNP